MSPSRPRWFKMSVAAIHRVGALEGGMHRRLPKGLILIVLCCFSMLASQAQIPSAAAQQPPTPQQVTPDPLGRETPLGTVFGFIKAAQEENYQLAVRYFQATSRRKPRQEDEKLAHQLNMILNLRFGPFLNQISKDPAGRFDDGLPADKEKVGEINIGETKFTLLLVRVSDKEAGKIWLISSETLAGVPDFYDLLGFPRLEAKLPRWLVDYRPLSMPVWQWIAIALLAPFAFGLAWFFVLLARLCYRLVMRWRKKPIEGARSLSAVGPITLLAALYLHYRFVNLLGASLLYRQYYKLIVSAMLAFGLYWVIARLTDFIVARIERGVAGRGEGSAHALLVLGSRGFDALAFIVFAFLARRSWVLGSTTALAGIGIGGIALGLGAQKTFENLFGGVSVISDNVLRVGDVCKVGNQFGRVEDIGMTSTQIRTLDRTRVSIPNGTTATANLENYSKRDKILFKQIVGLRRETSADQLRYVLAEVRRLLYEHSKVESATAQVRLVHFADASLNIEVFAYVCTTEAEQFLATQEDLLLRILDIVEKSGTQLAIAAQTVYLTRDKGLNPEKTSAAEELVNRWRENG